MSSSSLQNKEVRNTYGDLLLLKGTDGEGLTGGLKIIVDGLYNDTPFQLSDSAVKFTSNPIFTGILADSTDVFALKNGSGSTKWSFGIDSSAGVFRSESEFSLNVAGTNIFTTSSGNTAFVGNVSTLGNFAGPITGNVTGNVSGNVTGNVTGNLTGNVTGNVSGDVTGDLTGTIQTATQANITRVGTLGTLTVDNIIVNGTTIGHTSDTDLLTFASGQLTVAGKVSATELGGTLATAAQTNITSVGTLTSLTSSGTIESDQFTEGGSHTLSNDISGTAATATVAVSTLNNQFLLTAENKNFPIAFVYHDLADGVNTAYTKRFAVDDNEYIKFNPNDGKLMLTKTGAINLDSSGVIKANKIRVDGNIIEDNDGTDMITFDSSGNATLAGTTTGTFSGNGSALTNLTWAWGTTLAGLTELTGTNFVLDFSGNVEIEHGDSGKFTVTEGPDSNSEYLLTNYDGGTTNFILYENGGASHDDYFKIAVTAAGATTISTVDDNAAIAHLDFNIDGDIELKSAGNVEVLTDGIFRYKSYDGTSTYMTFGVNGGIGTANGIGLNGSAANMTLSNNEIDVSSGNLTLDVAGQIQLDSGNESHLQFKHNGVVYAEYNPAAANTYKMWAEGADTSSDYLQIAVAAGGRTTFTTVDAAGAEAHLSIKPDGNLTLSTDTGEVKMTNEDFVFENIATDDTAEGLIFKKLPAGENCSNNDKIGQLQFKAKNTNGDVHDFAYVYGQVGSPTDGSEWGKLVFRTAQQSDGALYNALIVGTDAGRGIQVGTNVDAGGNIICGGGNITLSTNELDVSSGAFTLDGGGDITIDSATGNITVKDNGGNYAPSSDYHIATKKYVDDLVPSNFLTNDADDIMNGNLTLRKVSNDANAAELILQKERSDTTIDDDDYVGKILFKAYDDQGTPEIMTAGEISTQVIDASSGDEKAKMYFKVLSDEYMDADVPTTFLSATAIGSGFSNVQVNIGSLTSSTIYMHGQTVCTPSNHGTENSDGKIHLKPYNSSETPHILIESNTDDGDYLKLAVDTAGASTISTVDDSGSSAANLILDVDGDIELNADAGDFTFKDDTVTLASISSTEFYAAAPISMKEYASAPDHASGKGKLWTKSDSPNNLYFTDDAGNDIAITNNGSIASPSVTNKTYLDWYYGLANLSSNDTFYVSLHHDEIGVTSGIDTNIADYNDTTAEDMWRILRYAGKRIPYTGTVTKFMVHVESTGASSDSDIEVGVWKANKPTLDSQLVSTTDMTIDNLGYLTFDFSVASRFIHKELTSFNATSVTQGDYMFITVRKTVGTDGSSFYINSTVTMDIS